MKYADFKMFYKLILFQVLFYPEVIFFYFIFTSFSFSIHTKRIVVNCSQVKKIVYTPIKNRKENLKIILFKILSIHIL